jgi:N-acetylglutamate synthase-like GNAT family acetyltransferase
MQESAGETEWVDVEIRAALEKDAGDISSILMESFEEYKPRFSAAAYEATTPAPDEILNRMKEGPAWVAISKGKIVGTISAVPRGTVMLLRDLAVRPSERGRSIGKMLLVHAARYAYHNKFRRLSMQAAPFLTRALREVEQFGFRRIDEGACNFDGTTPVYTMTKSL